MFHSQQIALYSGRRPPGDPGRPAGEPWSVRTTLSVAAKYHAHFTREDNIAHLLSGDTLAQEWFNGMWQDVIDNLRRQEQRMRSQVCEGSRADVRFFFTEMKERLISMLTDVVVEIRTSQRELDPSSREHSAAERAITKLNTRINALV
jgi:hypothetical protein